MNAVKTEFTFRSVSNLSDIHAAKFLPSDETQIKGVIQIAHGMAEHLERYEKFADALCEKGFAVYINDHLGHGASVSSESELGYFGEKDGYLNFVEDCKKLMDIAKKEHPDKPYIFFGHSMGSFVARLFSFKYANELTAAIICGTSGPNPAAAVAIKLANLVSKLKGDHYRSSFINSLAFGTYNSKFEKRTAFDWLTRDNDEVDKYIDDKLCGFLFTANGYRDLFSLLKTISSKKWFESFPKELPMLFVAGSMDPVGEYSKGVVKVCEKLKACGKTNVSLKLYENARHEILNENQCFNDVVSDVAAFAESVM